MVLDVGRTSGPLLLLLFCAQLYSRVLSMTGFTEAAKVFLLGTGPGPWGILLVMVAIWFVLGCLIDSISIILLTVPIFAPIAVHLGFDPLAFAIIGILAIEIGLLTPPFGMLVFTVKAAVPDATVTLAKFSAAPSPIGSCCWWWSPRWRCSRRSRRSCQTSEPRPRANLRRNLQRLHPGAIHRRADHAGLFRTVHEFRHISQRLRPPFRHGDGDAGLLEATVDNARAGEILDHLGQRVAPIA